MVVDPDGLRGTAPRFDALAVDVQDALATLSAVLDSEGSCWGNDQTGVSFGSSYGPLAERTLTLALAQDAALPSTFHRFHHASMDKHAPAAAAARSVPAAMV